MKRKIKLFMGLFLLMGTIVGSYRLSEKTSDVVRDKVSEIDNSNIVVVVDPGHGGEDPGKVGVTGIVEKEINLQIAFLLKEELEQQGIQVIMTREDDLVPDKKMEDMKERVGLINEARPDLVISIHQNSFSDERVRGPQVFYYKDSAEGAEVARLMQQELWGISGENIREAKENDTYYLLKKTMVPTVIVECGFLSSQEDSILLVQESYQQEMAKVICNGVIKWVDK